MEEYLKHLSGYCSHTINSVLKAGEIFEAFWEITLKINPTASCKGGYRW
jgi:hypothetical protein